MPSQVLTISSLTRPYRVQKLFTLLGCVVSKLSVDELLRFKLSKKEAVGHKAARLQFPLKLPETNKILTRKRKKFS